MNKKMSILNASMMQLRAAAAKAAATIESLTEGDSTLEGGSRIDEIVNQTLILSQYDTAIKLLQANFLTPMHEEMSKQRRATNGPPELASELTQNQKEQLTATLRRPPERSGDPELYPSPKKKSPGLSNKKAPQ